MAKATLKKTTKSAAKAKPAARTAAAKAPKTVKATAPAKKPAAVKAPVLSKDELRTQLEKALNTITGLRTKSREAVRAAKASAAQIGELEAKLAQLEKKLAAQAKPAKSAPAEAKPVKQRARKEAVKAAVAVPVEVEDEATVEPSDLPPAPPETDTEE
jgi:chromosome segregation ATPase